jgi:hypothetical protein
MGWYHDRVLPRIADVALRGAEITSARIATHRTTGSNRD